MVASTTKIWQAALSRSFDLRTPAYTRMSTIRTKSQCQPASRRVLASRRFSQSIRSAYPRKDSQDKDSINTEATEYSKSATDDEGARQEDAAFNPDITNPQEEMDKAGERTGKGTVSIQILSEPFLGFQLWRAQLSWRLPLQLCNAIID
jgi:hypothetical protein